MAIRATLALAVWGQALFILALSGQLRPAPIAITAALSFSVLFFDRGSSRLPNPIPSPPSPPSDSKARRTRRPLLHTLVFAALFGGLTLLALHPPLAFDETLYHLPFVRALAESGRLRVLPTLRFPVFPQIQELLFVPLFLLAGDAACHLMSLLEAALTAFVLYEWARRYDARAAPLAAALFLGSPIVLHLATIGYVEPALTLFVTAAASCLDLARQGERFALASAGFLLGTACSVKYTGWYFAAAGFAFALLFAVPRFRNAATFAIAWGAATLPTTLWIVSKTGNPLFPFLERSPWSHPLRAVGLQERVLGTMRLVWDVTFARDRVNSQPPVTPFLAVVLLLVLAAAVRDAAARFVAIAATVYVAVFSLLPQDSRYLVPLLPLVAVIAAITACRRWPAMRAWVSLVAIAPGVLYVVYRAGVMGTPPMSAAARTALLERRVPEYRALRHAGTAPVFACGAEQLQYFAGGKLLGDVVTPDSYARFASGAISTSGIAEDLRHVDAAFFLVAKSVCRPPRADGGMALVYDDDAAQLWRIQRSPHSR